MLNRKLGAAVAIVSGLLLAAGANAHEFKVGQIEIEHPWSRATPAGAKVAAGYVGLENDGDTPDKLVAATAEIAGHTEIHQMSVKDGVMEMRPVPEGVPVPSKGEAKLEPSGYHLMFMDLRQPLKQGDKFAGTLTFEKAGEVKVEFVVESMGATKPDHDHKKMK